MKKTLSAITLAIVLTFGTTFANAGIIVIGKADDSAKSDSCVSDTKEGIIVIGVAALVNALTGIIVIGKATEPCSDSTYSKDGIIVIG